MYVRGHAPTYTYCGGSLPPHKVREIAIEKKAPKFGCSSHPDILGVGTGAGVSGCYRHFRCGVSEKLY